MHQTRTAHVTRRLLSAVIFSATLVVSHGARAGAASAGESIAKEVAAELAEQVGQKGSREFLDATAVELERIADKCGSESLDVIQKQGIAAFRVFRSAGDDAGPYLIKAIRTYSDDAIRVAQTSAGRVILREGSDSAIRAVARHSDAVIPVIQKYGEDCARALAEISEGNGRRLVQLAEEHSFPANDFDKLMLVVEKYGDRAMDFIWRNRNPLLMTAAFTAFVSDPAPYIDGVKKLTEVATKPLQEFFEGIVSHVSWNFLVGVIVALVGLKLVFTRRTRRSSPNGDPEKSS